MPTPTPPAIAPPRRTEPRASCFLALACLVVTAACGAPRSRGSGSAGGGGDGPGPAAGEAGDPGEGGDEGGGEGAEGTDDADDADEEPPNEGGDEGGSDFHPGDEGGSDFDPDPKGEGAEGGGGEEAAEGGQGAEGGEGQEGQEGGEGGEGGEGAPDCEPTREVCDGRDNDCDREVDEDDPDLGDACDTGMLGPCWQGRKRCQEGSLDCVGVVDPLEEICDGVDNDCDGEFDEGRPESNQRCNAEIPGACGFGLTRCEDGFLWCDGLDPTPEVCDLLDNDCDGAVDNGMPDVVCGLGACQDIVPACVDGEAVPCEEGVPAEEEIPDNEIDDDCDGRTDEHGELEVVSDVALAAGQFNQTHSNFHPQSMTWDPATGALAIMQQRRSNIDLVSLEGVRTATIVVGLSHTTGIAADPSDEENFYITDYTGNRGGPDLFRITRAGQRTQISNDNAAYGGFPLAVFDGQMWRAENSNGYDWSALRTVTVRAIDAPDVILDTFQHGVNRGPDDYCHDGDTLWMLGWEDANEGQVDIFALDPDDGEVLSEHDDLFACQAGNPAGLACDLQGNMWVWCYSENQTQSRFITLIY